MSAAQVRELYSEFYKDSYFVRIRPEGEFPATKEVYGSNFCDISVTVDERTNRATIVSVIDNLMVPRRRAGGSKFKYHEWLAGRNGTYDDASLSIERKRDSKI